MFLIGLTCFIAGSLIGAGVATVTLCSLMLAKQSDDRAEIGHRMPRYHKMLLR